MPDIQQPISKEDYKAINPEDINTNTDLTVVLDRVLVPSDVFIKPTAANGANMVILLILCRNLLIAIEKMMKDTTMRGNQASRQYTFVKIMYEILQLEGDLNSNEDHEKFNSLLKDLNKLILKLNTYFNGGYNLFKKVKRLMRIGKSLLEMHQNYGDRLLGHYRALQKLTVIMKCTDYVWTDIRRVRGKVAKLDTEIAELSNIDAVFWIPIIDDHGNKAGVIKRTLAEIEGELP